MPSKKTYFVIKEYRKCVYVFVFVFVFTATELFHSLNDSILIN